MAKTKSSKRTISLPDTLYHRLIGLANSQEQNNSALICQLSPTPSGLEYKVQFLEPSAESLDHIRPDPQTRTTLERFLSNNPEYGIIWCHTHGKGMPKSEWKKFTDGDLSYFQEQLQLNPEFIGMMISPKGTLAIPSDTVIQIVNTLPAAYFIPQQTVYRKIQEAKTDLYIESLKPTNERRPELAKIFSEVGIRKGSRVVMIPAYYGHEDVGCALRELGAKATFVVKDDRGERILDKIKALFPNFEVVGGDALTYNRDGVDYAIHWRGDVQYIHEELHLGEKSVMRVGGYEKMIQNIAGWSPRLVLLSPVNYFDGPVPPQFNTAADADRATIQNYGLRLINEGVYNSPKPMRWHFFERSNLRA